MTIEVRIDNNEPLSKEIEGRNFRIPTITRKGENYKLDNFHLLPDWEDHIETYKRVNLQAYCNNFALDFKKLEGKVLYDEDTGLITRVNFNEDQNVGVFLHKSIDSRGGVYEAKRINKLSDAIIYQQFMSRYLYRLNKIPYAFIANPEPYKYGSQDMIIPRKLVRSETALTTDKQKEGFFQEAVYITGQFSTKLNYIKYTDNGLINLVQIDSNDCHYSLDLGNYGAHNVDTIFQAATLHGIVAAHTNEIIERREREDRA